MTELPTLVSGVPNGTLFPGFLCLSAVKAAEWARSGELKSELGLVARRNVSEFCRPFIVDSFGYQGSRILWILWKNFKATNHVWLNCS